MKTYLNEISGIADAIVSMLMSRRTWNRPLENEIRTLCDTVLDRNGKISSCAPSEAVTQYTEWLTKLVKWGTSHITMLRFIDFSITVEGLHRAGQDDWDAHAARFNNRIIRNSTRLATFEYETSDWYQGKIIPTDAALAKLGITAPDTLIVDDKTYVKTTNGYILEEMSHNSDVKRGLYMLSIPSNFIFKVNLTEWAHVFKERNGKGHSNPEVMQCCESIADQMAQFQPLFNRDLFMAIKN